MLDTTWCPILAETYAGLPSATLSLCLSGSSPMSIKSSIQKAEVKYPKQPTKYEDHRRKFIPNSYVITDLSSSKELKKRTEEAV